jgi:uncharacterized protein (DUF488 family)
LSATFWTIGHSTRPIEEFIGLLKAHGVRQLIDVRTIPQSRHNPQFNTDQLAKRLKKGGLAYLHMPDLGGLRKAKKDSINLGWRNESFRGYADYMQTDEFWSALEGLIASGQNKNTAIMCAEAVPWRCHRSLIADALVVRGCEVWHIMSETKADRHQLTPFATYRNGLLHYPALNAAPRLF